MNKNEDDLIKELLLSSASHPDLEDPTLIAVDENGKWYTAKELWNANNRQT